MKTNRREFLSMAALGAVGMAAAKASPQPETRNQKTETGNPNPQRILFGACIGDTVDKSLPGLKEAGYDFFETSAENVLIPGKGEPEWKAWRRHVESFGLPLRSCNGFYSNKFRLTGPEPRWEEALRYAEICCRRGDELGLKYIVLGSGGARNQPEGFPNDKAVEQFTEFCKRLADRISFSNVTIVLEPLPKKVVKYLWYVWEGVEIAKKVDDPHLRVLADMRHMANNGESPDSILKAGTEFIKHTHIAVMNNQIPGFDDPGTVPQMLQNLKKIGYTGGVSLEGVCGATQIGKLPEDSEAMIHGRRMALAVMKSWLDGKVI